MIRARDIDILARTVWGEARGEDLNGKIAVAWVVLNRMSQGHWSAGGTIADTCQRRAQFSCWLPSDHNRPLLDDVTLEDPDYQDCVYAALGAILGYLDDPTGGATHYHTRGVHPHWAEGQTPCAEIGNHRFYRNIK